MLTSNLKNNILVVSFAILLITTIALWKQNSSLKQQIADLPQNKETLAVENLNSEEELQLLQDQLKQLLELKNQLEE
ncbi:MAG: hypothetical protein ABH822_02730 [Patescibacteria group bacterium]